MGFADLLNRPVHGPGSEPGGELDWPWWLPVGTTLAAVAAALKALVDRDALVPPGPEVLLALLAVSPWLVENALAWMPPRPVFAAVVLAGATGLLLDPSHLDTTPFLLVLLSAEVASTSSLRVAIGTTVAAVAVMVACALRGFSGIELWIAGVVAAGAMGAAMQSRLRLLHQERQTSAARAEQAAVAERQRIAREIHDVVAHSLSVTMLHVTGTRHVLETEGDVDEAVVALRDAERLGRQAMVDIRRTVGLLGTDSQQVAPMPGLADLPHLVADFQTAGLNVRYELRGDPAAPSLATGLGLYRIAQESLANVAKHAPGAQVDVRLDLDGAPLRLTVRNTLPPGHIPAGAPTAQMATTSADTESIRTCPRSSVSGPRNGGRLDVDDGNGHAPQLASGAGGLGLQGMRQRAVLLGGELRAGRDGDGWCVEVVMPLAAEGVT